MSNSPKKSSRPGQVSLLGTASTMGLHMVSGPVVGGCLGWLADHWLGSWPIGAGIGLFLGMAAGFRNVWIDARYLARVNAEADAEVREQRENIQKPQPGARQTLAPDKTSQEDWSERKTKPGIEETFGEDEELEKILASFSAGHSVDTPSIKSLEEEKGKSQPQQGL